MFTFNIILPSVQSHAIIFQPTIDTKPEQVLFLSWLNLKQIFSLSFFLFIVTARQKMFFCEHFLIADLSSLIKLNYK